MTAFLWFVIALFAVDCWGKAKRAFQRDTVRDLDYMPLEIALSMAVLIWASYLLGTQP
jgi:hypothetical protein